VFINDPLLDPVLSKLNPVYTLISHILKTPYNNIHPSMLRSLKRSLPFRFIISVNKELGTRVDLREIGWEGVDRIQLAQDRDQWRNHVNTVMNLRIP